MSSSQPFRTGSVSGRKDSKGSKEKPSKKDSGTKSPSAASHDSISFFSKRRLKKDSNSVDVQACPSTTELSVSPGHTGEYSRFHSNSSASAIGITTGPLPSPKHMERQSTSLTSLDNEIYAPSIPEPIKKGHVRILLPNKQRTMIQIRKPEASLEEALRKAMMMRSLSPESCLVYRLIPEKRVLPWKSQISEFESEEISVEDKNNTTFQNTHRFISKGQMGVNYCEFCHKLMMSGVKCQTCGYKVHKHCQHRGTKYCDMNPDGPAIAATTTELINKVPANDSLQGIFNLRYGEDEEVTITRTNMDNMSTAYNQPTEPTKPEYGHLIRVVSAPSLNHEPMSSMIEYNTENKFSTPSGGTPDVEATREGTRARTMTAIDHDTGIGSDYPSSARKDPTPAPHGVFMDEKKESDWEIKMTDVRVHEKVGSGAYGTVYKGEYHGDVALKMLNVKDPSPELREVFSNEVKILMNTRHTRILLFMAWIFKPLCIVTQWCEGSSLYHLLHVVGCKLSQEQNMTIANQIAQGMDYLHSRKIIHRDLKSGNVLLEHNTNIGGDMAQLEVMLQLINVKIADFGLSAMHTAFSSDKMSQAKQQPLGSLLWMSPEIIQMKVTNPYTQLSDVYAFGVILFELITVSLPYPEIRNRDQLLWMIGSGMLRIDLESTGKKYEYVPRAFRVIFKKSVSFNRDDRPTFSQIDFDLRHAIHQVPRLIRHSSLPSLFNKRSDF